MDVSSTVGPRGCHLPPSKIRFPSLPTASLSSTANISSVLLISMKSRFDFHWRKPLHYILQSPFLSDASMAALLLQKLQDFKRLISSPDSLTEQLCDLKGFTSLPSVLMRGMREWTRSSSWNKQGGIFIAIVLMRKLGLWKSHLTFLIKLRGQFSKSRSCVLPSSPWIFSDTC